MRSCLPRGLIRLSPVSPASSSESLREQLTRRTLECRNLQQVFSCRRYTPFFMSKTQVPFTTEAHARKRRRISTTALQDPAMAVQEGGQESALPTIELTKAEHALRQLLLDVAAHTQRKNAERTGEKTEPSELRFTGGWVRDKILGVGSEDIDVGINDMTGHTFGLALEEYLALPGKAEEYARLASDGESFDRAVGSLHKIAANPDKSKHLETCKTRVFNLELDLVNLRKETYTEDSRNPQMEFGTPLEDALRRDATVNALFYNLQTSSVEDFTKKGIQDIKDKVLRTPMAPHQTFQDDPLRVLRLIRFASRLGYNIHPDTQEAMKDEGMKRSFKTKITKERVGMELQKMLAGPDPLAALQYIDRLGLYDTILPSEDDVSADTTSWSQVFNSLNAIINDEYHEVPIPSQQKTTMRRILIRNDEERYYSWMVATLCPWAAIPPGPPTKKAGRTVPRPAAVARDSLRVDNKLVKILSASGQYYQMVDDLKTAFLAEKLGNTTPDIRWKIAECIRTLGREWRFCVLQAMLLQIMDGAKAADVCRDYEKLLLYIEEQDLLEIDSLKPCVDGTVVSKELGVKRGAWMSKAMEMVVEWQVRNPENQQSQAAINSVIQRKEELGLN